MDVGTQTDAARDTGIFDLTVPHSAYPTTRASKAAAALALHVWEGLHGAPSRTL